MTKECTRCGIEKDLNEFSSNNKTKDGKQKWCNPCFNSYRRERREQTVRCKVLDKEKGLVRLWGKQWKLTPLP